MIKARIEWKLQDLWVGVYWKDTPEQLDIWICLIPCLPLHITRHKRPARYRHHDDAHDVHPGDHCGGL